MGWRLALVLLLALDALASSAGPAQAQPSASIPPFLSSLDVLAPGGARDGVSFGLAEGATSGYDRGVDAPEPPPPPGGPWASAYASAASGPSRLHRSVLAPASEVAWALHVDVDGRAGEVALRFERAFLDALPHDVAFDVTLDNVTHDLRETGDFRVAKAEGRAGLALVVRAYPLQGEAPSAPRALRASPSTEVGEARLSWDAPETDGGHPLRRYHVYRASADAPEWRLVNATKGTSFVDRDLEAGASYRYYVRAVNRVGEGPSSDEAEALGTGKPSGVRPREPEPDEERREVASHEARQEPREVEAEPQHVGAGGVRGGRDKADPDKYEVEARRPDGRTTTLGVFTGGAPAPDAEASADETPGARQEAPGAEGGADAGVRCFSDGQAEAGAEGSFGVAGERRREGVAAPLPAAQACGTLP